MPDNFIVLIVYVTNDPVTETNLFCTDSHLYMRASTSLKWHFNDEIAMLQTKAGEVMPSNQEEFKRKAAGLSIVLDERELQLFNTYATLLQTHNESCNLTSIEVERFHDLHFLDSLAPLNYLELPLQASIIDIGCGAGLPGIPLKIVRKDLRLTLLDATQKKIDFVKTAVHKLGLENTDCVHGRAEVLAHNTDHREAYDCAVSRAVAALPVLLEYMLPFVRVGGFCLALKGPGAEIECQAAEEIVNTLGGSLQKPLLYKLPDSTEERTIVLVEKVSSTPEKYPEREKAIRRKNRQ